MNPYTHSRATGEGHPHKPRSSESSFEVILDPGEIREYVSNEMDKRNEVIDFEDVDPEWIHFTRAVELLRSSPERVRRIFEGLKPKYPNRYAKVHGKGRGGQAEYFDPIFLEEAKEIIDRENKSRGVSLVKETTTTRPEERPIEYQSIAKISEELGQDKAILDYIIHSKFHGSENFLPAIIGIRKETEISLKCIVELKELISNWEVKPEGAKALPEFVDKNGLSVDEKNKAVRLFNDGRRIFKDTDGKIKFFVTLDKEAEILEELRPGQIAPEAIPAGSVKINDLYEELGREFVQGEFKRLHTAKPGFVRENTTQPVKGEEQWAFPELVKFLRGETEEEDGFIMRKSFAEKLGVAIATFDMLENYLLESKYKGNKNKIDKEKRNDKRKGVLIGPNLQKDLEKEVARRRDNTKKTGQFTFSELIQEVKKEHTIKDVDLKVNDLLKKMDKSVALTAFDDALRPMIVYGREVLSKVNAEMPRFYDLPPAGWRSLNGLISDFDKKGVPSGEVRTYLMNNSDRLLDGRNNIFRDQNNNLEYYFPQEADRGLNEFFEERMNPKMLAGYIPATELEDILKGEYEDKYSITINLGDIMGQFLAANPNFKKDHPDFEKKDPRLGETGPIYEKGTALNKLRRFIQDNIIPPKEHKAWERKEFVTAREIAADTRQGVFMIERGLDQFVALHPEAVRIEKRDGVEVKVYNRKIIDRKFRDFMKRVGIKY